MWRMTLEMPRLGPIVRAEICSPRLEMKLHMQIILVSFNEVTVCVKTYLVVEKRHEDDVEILVQLENL